MADTRKPADAARGDDRLTFEPDPTRAAVISPVLTSERRAAESSAASSRAAEARHEEAIGLTEAIDLDVAFAEIVSVSTPRPATLLGTGKLEEIAARVEEEAVEVVIIDHPLTPVQQRNLEKALKAKVLDRTGLILEIFGRRARTKEGRLQVDLAHLEYQRGRLVRSWTHLERQRGGGGFMGGPGETQIEADRRQLQERIMRLKKDLEQVRRTRDLHRAKRRKVPFPIVAIVGYTNAGKSTLFNRLTGASVMAEDMLFATLDPTLRRVQLPHGTTIILSDTVGFISDLPTHLVAAFRATLEEVIEADLIVHLRDISDPDTAAQVIDVNAILGGLGVDAADRMRVLEVWNKIDSLDPERRRALLEGTRASDAPLAISAITGEGISDLLALIEERISGQLVMTSVELSPDRMSLLDWIYRNGEVVERSNNDDGSISLKVRMTETARQDVQEQLSGNKTSR